MGILKSVSIFAGLTDEQEANIEGIALRRFVPKNTIVINEGDEASSMYIILKGRVKVYLNDRSGKEIVINDMAESDYFGEYPLFDGGRRSASIITVEDCEFLIINQDTILSVFRENPETAFTLIRDMVSRIRELSISVKNLALMDVYGRVANTLLHFARDEDGIMITEVRLTQQDIANRVGASREMVAKVLKDLERGGYISRQGKRIVINDRLPGGY